MLRLVLVYSEWFLCIPSLVLVFSEWFLCIPNLVLVFSEWFLCIPSHSLKTGSCAFRVVLAYSESQC